MWTILKANTLTLSKNVYLFIQCLFYPQKGRKDLIHKYGQALHKYVQILGINVYLFILLMQGRKGSSYLILNKNDQICTNFAYFTHRWKRMKKCFIFFFFFLTSSMYIDTFGDP